MMPLTMQPFHLGLLQVTTTVFTIMILRQSNHLPSGKFNLTEIKNGETGEEHTHFFDYKGIVYKEFVPAGQTVSSTLYCEILHEIIQRSCPEL